MSGFLYAMHDFSRDWARLITEQGKMGWAVTTHALGSDPHDRSGHDFSAVVSAGMTPVARLNNGYHPGGTIPLPQDYPRFAERCRNFVASSSNCIRWIIGNEPNLSIERPNGTPILPRQCAECFVLCRNAIKQAGVHHQVIVGAVGPYNVETGDWIAYWNEVLVYIQGHGGADGLAIHSYLRNHTPNDVVSEEKMLAPGYTDRYANFRAYRDIMAHIPREMRQLPVYMTEANPIPGWDDKDDGTVQAIYREINGWNETLGNQKIKCVALYRWPKYDNWWIEGKNGVIADFRKAVGENYISPLDAAPSEHLQTNIPIVSTGPASPPAAAENAVDIDPALIDRGVGIIDAARPQPGKGYWRARRLDWLDVADAREVGPDHHILGRITRNGMLAVDVPFKVTWPNGVAEVKSKADDAFGFNYDFGMSSSLREFSIEVADGNASDKVTGIGMGKDGNPSIHTSTWIDWEWSVVPTVETPPAPTTPAPMANPVPILVHPVPEPSMRAPSQLFGGNAAYYSQFAVDGVPLRGHNGLDFPTPVGTPVRAVADGVVKETWVETGGYGLLVLLNHEWGESLYAHLDRRLVEPGDTVKAGQIIALTGASGKVTGPHLHFGMRLRPYNRADGWGGYLDPLPFLGNAVSVPVTPVQDAPPPSALFDPIVLAAIIEVESRGVAFGPGGHMVIRFEPHIFKDMVSPAAFDAAFRLGSPEWVGEHHRFLDPTDKLWKEFHGPINSHQQFEHRAFLVATAINADAAHESVAMGVGQVMGFNARRAGYASARQMFKVLERSLSAQVLAVVAFVLSDPALHSAVIERNFEKVAELYNGSGQVATYAKLMREAFARLSA